MITDSSGTKIASGDIDYSEFGEHDGGSSDEYSYTGKKADFSAGLVYFNARYYFPEIGRFISMDPVKSGVNLYVYCANNPLKYVDLTGLIEGDGDMCDGFAYHGIYTHNKENGVGMHYQGPAESNPQSVFTGPENQGQSGWIEWTVRGREDLTACSFVGGEHGYEEYVGPPPELYLYIYRFIGRFTFSNDVRSFKANYIIEVMAQKGFNISIGTTFADVIGTAILPASYTNSEVAESFAGYFHTNYGSFSLGIVSIGGGTSVSGSWNCSFFSYQFGIGLLASVGVMETYYNLIY